MSKLSLLWFFFDNYNGYTNLTHYVDVNLHLLKYIYTPPRLYYSPPKVSALLTFIALLCGHPLKTRQLLKGISNTLIMHLSCKMLAA